MNFFNSKVNYLIANLFVWTWMASSIAIPILILWAIFGNGKWYYPIIPLLVGSFCKKVCDEYKRRFEALFYASMDTD